VLLLREVQLYRNYIASYILLIFIQNLDWKYLSIEMKRVVI